MGSARRACIGNSERRWRLTMRAAGRSAVLSSLLLAAAILGPSHAQQAPQTTAQLRGEITALVARQAGLVNGRDAAALSELFTHDATYVAANGAAYIGQARIRAYYVQLFGILQSSHAIIGTVVRQAGVEQVVALGDGAWATGRGINRAVGRAGPVTTTYHWVAIFARVGNEWKIRLFSVGEDAPRSDPPQ